MCLLVYRYLLGKILDSKVFDGRCYTSKTANQRYIRQIKHIDYQAYQHQPKATLPYKYPPYECGYHSPLIWCEWQVSAVCHGTNAEASSGSIDGSLMAVLKCRGYSYVVVDGAIACRRHCMAVVVAGTVPQSNILAIRESTVTTTESEYYINSSKDDAIHPMCIFNGIHQQDCCGLIGWHAIHRERMH
jgi:hypothetical protein